MSARIGRLAAVILFAAVAFAAVGKAQPAAEPLPVAASQEIGGAAQMSGPGVTETLAEREATISGFVEARLQVLGDHLHGLFAALPGLPAELAVAGARLRDELAGRGLLEFACCSRPSSVSGSSPNCCSCGRPAASQRGSRPRRWPRRAIGSVASGPA